MEAERRRRYELGAKPTRGEPDTGISAATESKTSRENTRHSDESTDAAVSSMSDRERPVYRARRPTTRRRRL